MGSRSTRVEHFCSKRNAERTWVVFVYPFGFSPKIWRRQLNPRRDGEDGKLRAMLTRRSALVDAGVGGKKHGNSFVCCPIETVAFFFAFTFFFMIAICLFVRA